ncbi:MAG: hypothetical protein QOG63_822 [Thermoleophilaceae bacterium]|jgi:hypothetical protein|nr:hypothetical protein [Thermoleophilaceae bacterium]
MTRRLTTLLAVIAVCTGALGLTSSAHAARGMEVAMQDDATFLLGLRNPFKGLDKAAALHTTYIRTNVVWNSVVNGASSKKKPKHLKYKWRAYDDLIQRAGERGMAVEMTLTVPAPRWATGGKKKNGIYKPNAKLFGQFTHDAAAHFTPLGVKRYSVGNEANLRLWLAPLKSAPKLYRGLYIAAYGAIKGVDSSNQVLIGETAPYSTPGRTMAPLEFLRGVTCVNARYKSPSCKGLKTDGYAHHPYDYKHKPTYKYPGKDNVTLATISRLTKALSKLHSSKALTTPSGGTPEVYLTEYGYFAGANYKLPQKTQAKYLVQGFTMAQKNKHVRQMLQYLLVPPQPGKGDFFATQIMNTKFKPLKAYTALKKWADKLAPGGGIATSP